MVMIRRKYYCPTCGLGNRTPHKLRKHFLKSGHEAAALNLCLDPGSCDAPSAPQGPWNSWAAPGTNRGRQATGANRIELDCGSEAETEAHAAEALPPLPGPPEVQGCWLDQDELRGPQMTVPKWVGPTPLSSLPVGWRLGYDEESKRPFFWNEADPEGSTSWQDPRLDSRASKLGEVGDETEEQELDKELDEGTELEEVDSEDVDQASMFPDSRLAQSTERLAADKDPLQEFLETARPVCLPRPLPRSIAFQVHAASHLPARSRAKPSQAPLLRPAAARSRSPPWRQSRAPGSGSQAQERGSPAMVGFQLLQSLRLHASADSLAAEVSRSGLVQSTAISPDVFLRALAEALSLNSAARQALRSRVEEMMEG
ncbi:unnamed protein product [Polarella glacialis]|uniref:WW domain-containing protein n=1 Tax=Polarella glacialis TaxID=89957 RepID=A0A813G318_POLGL|nr:unnamed protein product [Polarella glacialis]